MKYTEKQHLIQTLKDAGEMLKSGEMSKDAVQRTWRQVSKRMRELRK